MIPCITFIFFLYSVLVYYEQSETIERHRERDRERERKQSDHHCCWEYESVDYIQVVLLANFMSPFFVEYLPSWIDYAFQEGLCRFVQL